MAKKSDNLELQRRIKAVATYIIQGYSTSDIVQNASSKWDVSRRQAYSYIQEAFQLIHEDVVKDLENSLVFHKKARLDMYRDLVREKDRISRDQTIGHVERVRCLTALNKEIQSILMDLGKLEGHYVEKKEIEHKGAAVLAKLPGGIELEL